MTPRLDRLFSPTSVAVVGASTKPGYGRRTVESLRLMGFAGPVVAVHPTGVGPDGVPAYRTLAQVPFVPDAVVAAIPAAGVPGVVAEAAEIGAGGVVAFASGFGESGDDGRRLEHELRRAAGDRIPVLGPNCLGLVNYRTGAALWGIEAPRHQQPRGGHVAVISQSGAMLITTLLNGRIPDVAYAASVGNQAVLDVNDCLEFALTDPQVRTVALIVEGIADLARFRALARQARQRSVVVVLKLGRSARAQAATIAHTGTLAGDDDVFSAVLAQSGAVRVDDLDGLVAMCALADHGVTHSLGDLAVFATSGGEGGLVADVAEAAGVRLVDLDEGTRRTLTGLVPPFGSVANPFDLTAGAWGDQEVYRQVTRALATCPGTGLVAMVGDAPTYLEKVDGSGWAQMLEGAGDAARATGVPVAVVTTTTDVIPDFAAAAREHGVLLLAGVGPALSAIAAAQRVRSPAQSSADGAEAADDALVHAARAIIAGHEGQVSEGLAKRLISLFGVDVPGGGEHVDIEQLEQIAATIGYPVVCKVVGIAHKSDVGGVEVGIADSTALRTACERIRTATASAIDGPVVIRVEQMVAGGVEAFVGGRRSGAEVVVVVGAGGVLTELISDVRTFVWPFGPDDVRQALSGLRIHRLLTGFRGRPPADVDALVEVALATGRLLATLPEVVEIDLNPVLVSPTAAVAADALVVTAPAQDWTD